MNFFGIVGAIVILCCAVIVAKRTNLSGEAVIEQYSSYARLVAFTRLQIECFALPCEEIIARCDPSIISGCGYALDHTPKNFRELVNGSLIADAELSRLAKGFSMEFGRGYRSDELKLCDEFLFDLRDKERKLRDELQKKKKVTSTLCISLALSAIILLF